MLVKKFYPGHQNQNSKGKEAYEKKQLQKSKPKQFD